MSFCPPHLIPHIIANIKLKNCYYGVKQQQNDNKQTSKIISLIRTGTGIDELRSRVRDIGSSVPGRVKPNPTPDLPHRKPALYRFGHRVQWGEERGADTGEGRERRGAEGPGQPAGGQRQGSNLHIKRRNQTHPAPLMRLSSRVLSAAND